MAPPPNSRPNGRPAGRAAGTTLFLPMRVWDLPIRLFHWGLVAVLLTSYLSVTFNQMDLHLLSGYAIATLLLFRVAWGIVGSDTARFARFLHSPLAGLRHLVQFRAAGPDTEVGHNAAGGWMVVGMLLLLGAQVGTGLYANDDGATEGPLAHLVSKGASDALSGWHGFIFNLILAVVALHLCALLAYRMIKRHDLVRPMITGKKRLPATTKAPRMASTALAGALLALAAVVVWVVATRL